MINIHGHIFDFRFVPEKFIALSSWLLKTPKHFKLTSWLLHKLIPFTDKDILDKYATFLESMGKDQYEILQAWQSNYPSGTIFCPLTVDLENMGRGKTQEPYLTQVKEVLEYSKESTSLYPFIMVDPRSSTLDEQYDLIEENIQHIGGLKLYPLVGYYAHDERLDRFYDLMEKHQKAVTLHCTPQNAVYYSGRDIDKLLDKTCPYYYKGYNNKEKAGNFAHPYHTVKVAEKYRNINFNLAHFGGEYHSEEDAHEHLQWRDYIIEAIRLNPNIYSDISFTYAKRGEQLRLKDTIKMNPFISDKLLYGDDEYMIRTKVNGLPFYTQLKEILGYNTFEKIANSNPREFLRINNPGASPRGI
jgi:predicted TIM-barrel fold metal-dependent hydrolase